MLTHFGVEPYLVFDGDYLPSKAKTEEARELKRAESKRKGEELLRMGKQTEAFHELQKAVDVTPELARQLIEELKRHNIHYVVAPYEADAQLAYLEKKGIIQGVISEDSDLLVFGVQRLITKLDNYGECIEINRKDFTACREVNLVGWSDAEFRHMAILSGCDYLSNCSKIGLKTAYYHIQKYKKIERVIQILQLHPKFKVPPGYLECFWKAEQTFLHQRVYCPLEKRVVMLTHLEDPPEDFDFIGKHIERAEAIGIANGSLHPMTKRRLTWSRVPLKNSPSSWKSSKTVSTSTPSNPKQEKPIDTFLKPKRVPLAELDPNSFTPSPSQRRLLDAHPGSISSTPITASTHRPITNAGSSRQPSQVPRGRQSLGSVSSSAAKRPRLCEDLDDGVKKASRKEGQEQERSRFFSSASEQPSPCIGKKPGIKKRGDLRIWSDDSIDDIISGLPDPSQHRKKTPTSKTTSKFDVYADTKKEEKKPSRADMDDKGSFPTQHSSMSNLAKKGSLFSAGLPPKSVPCATVDSNTSQALARIIQPSLAKDRLQALVGSTTMTSMGSKPSLNTKAIATVAHEVKISLRAPDGLDDGGGGESFTATEPLTITQGEKLIDVSKSSGLSRLHALGNSKTNGYCTQTQQPNLKHAKSHKIGSIEGVKDPEHKSRQTQLLLRGSEDFIIPDSDGDEEEEEWNSEGALDRQDKPKVDFASFLYRR